MRNNMRAIRTLSHCASRTKCASNARRIRSMMLTCSLLLSHCGHLHPDPLVTASRNSPDTKGAWASLS